MATHNDFDIDLNTATLEELEALPVLDRIARRPSLTQDRSRHGSRSRTLKVSDAKPWHC